ncbi:hypothetical protein [Jhaorihella thermophila]|uniref:hypothetical protein n=1 Tax=Jhaorihella thermophila TaxID=488547 RepID=UPI00361A80F6
MVEPANPELSIGKQCKLLSISRSSFYYQPKGETALNLMLMRQIDEQFLETPFFGVQQMTWHLRNEGHLVNEKRIRVNAGSKLAHLAEVKVTHLCDEQARSRGVLM